MKSILLKQIGNISHCDVEKPVPKKGEVLVKVKASGICGSDIKRVYKEGAHNMPLIIGHEFAGCVCETGEGVSDDWIGKRVAIFPLIPCKKCSQCIKHNYEMCEKYNYLGSRCNGGMAEYVCVPKWNLLEIPDSVSYEQAAMMEPMAVATHAMRRIKISEGDTVVVSGLGTIGMLLTMFLHDAKIKNLILLGNKDIQKNIAARIGIAKENFCDIREMDPYDFIMNRSEGKGADVFYECVGNNSSINMALKSIASSGRICFVGNPNSDILLDMNNYWKILRKQVTILGTWNSSYIGEENVNDDADDWKYCVSRMEKGTVKPEILITHKYPLEKLIEGLEIMRDKSEEYIKIMGLLD